MKNKVLLGSLFLAFLSSNIFAQDIDEEIQRLEKENKLLELKKKQKQLQNELQDDNLSSNTTQAKKESNQKDLSRAKEKSGFFIGVEAELGSIDLTHYAVNDLDPDRILNFTTTKSNFTYNGGLLLGYQKYFGESAKHGLKISTHLYSGLGYNLSKSLHLPAQIVGMDHYLETWIDLQLSMIPIKFGFDIKYLWDFLEKEKYTLGLNVGLGYSIDYYIAKYSTFSNNQYGQTATKPKTKNPLLQAIYLTLGLHYAYKKHHIFEINYRFGGIFGIQGNLTTSPTIEGQNMFQQYRLSILTQSYLTLNYAYKF